MMAEKTEYREPVNNKSVNEKILIVVVGTSGKDKGKV